MPQKQTVVFTSLSLFVLGLFIGAIILLSGGLTSKPGSTEPESTWRPPTINDIYSPYDSLEIQIDDYIWPTDVTRTLTSAFGEFRSTHFHAGIDISTRGQIGAPVFASQDGYIEQIGVSPFGYGKYILMRHPDGYATLYAHLDSFDDPIEERVYAYQNDVGRYNVTMQFEPDEFTYKQGDLIARSGSTGSGPPHIHFEIRDVNNNPLNPKFSNDIAINDRMPPIFNRLAAIPVDAAAFVNDRITPVTIPAIAINPGEYVIRNPVRVSGTVGLAADVHDRNNDTWYRHGIYSMEFFIEDSLYYSVQYDRIPMRHRHQIRLHYDHHLLNTGRGRFQKLFIEEGNVLPLYGRREHGSGLLRTIELEQDTYNFTINAYDFAGNISTLTGSLAVDNSPATENKPAVSPRLDNKPHRLITESELEITNELYRDMLIINITHPEYVDTSTSLVIKQGSTRHTVPFVQDRGYTHQGRLKLQPSSESNLHFYYVYNDTVYTYTETVYSIRPEDKGELLLDGGKLRLAYDEGAVYYPVYFTIDRIENEDHYYYSFNSTSSVLDEGIRYTIRAPDDLEPFERSVIYTRSRSRWSAANSARDPEIHSLSSRTRSMLNDVKVAVDTTAPSISNVIVDGNRNMRLRFRVDDEESGIDHSSLSIKLNNDRLIGRYDPDLSMVIYRTREPLAPGEYDLSISVADRAGNNTTYERIVHIR